jgi:hypothetical protein
VFGANTVANDRVCSKQELEHLAAEARAAETGPRVEHELGVRGHLVVRDVGMVDQEHDEVGLLELRDAVVDAGNLGSERCVGRYVTVVRTSAPNAMSGSPMIIADDSRQSDVPALYARPRRSTRAPFTARPCGLFEDGSQQLFGGARIRRRLEDDE